MRYVAFIHTDGDRRFGISFPDFPGIISAGDTFEETLRNDKEALAFCVEDMSAEDIPCPRSIAEIEADEALSAWREGATFTLVPLILDKGTQRRVTVPLDSPTAAR